MGPILRIWVSHLQQKKTCKNRASQQTIGPLIIDLLDMKLIIKNLLNLSQNIVLTCRSGRRVLVADKILKRKGYLNLRIYSGSFKDWVKNRGTVIKDSQEDLDYFWILEIRIKRYEYLFLLSFFNGIKVDQFVFLPIFFANFTIDFCQFSRTMSLVVNVITFKTVTTTESVCCFALFHSSFPLTSIPLFKKGRNDLKIFAFFTRK